ncbi:acyl-CoA dehydrogenase family protein [Amycolatopsis viridis]|uniref:Alkylation response protein AidB-like acyl-CoA dehydrogenase n=1 Tax=Amycolatopsis viridis TaxID=185678 RepID=A0ABX0SY88_9PSEU|nr:acyl-CoA dehydrogenase family protein [Amycolatopsis viridis]NIH80300.1 alkylation response protein AidB-like acyl-CoA dehydrogenase [Amycolatopsis viridis]
MTWRGPLLDEEQRDLASLLDAVAADRAVAPADDAPETVAALVRELAGLGVWTLGTAESAGGAGAGWTTTAVAFERLGRSWPALGWAAVQAHAAVDVLGADPRFADLVGAIHAGEAGVAVVDGDAAHVRLAWQGESLSGAVDRVDAAARSPHLLVLTGADEALLVPPAATKAAPLRRTGLGGALTVALDVAAGAGEVHQLTGVAAAAARHRLLLGAAAVATGIAGAAADDAAGYTAVRHQFGRALHDIPVVRMSLFEQAARTAAALAAVTSAVPDELAALAVARECCDAAIEVAAAAVQAHGGYGYLAEYPVERRLRDAVSLRAAAGTHGTAARTPTASRRDAR